MYLSVKERNIILKLIETMGQSLDSETMRESAGYVLLDLLKSDQFASFVWNEEKNIFEKGVWANMSDSNMANYCDYYQNIDPITSKMSVSKNAILVNEVMPQKELVKTEFYNDFLAKDGLHNGINLFAYNNDKNTGDFRIWRKKGRSSFDEKSAFILDFIKPYFRNAMNNIAQHETALLHVPKQIIYTEKLNSNELIKMFSLTKREAQITLEIVQGLTDDAIAEKLHIAFSTLRTHIKHIFHKLSVNNRALLINKVFYELSVSSKKENV